MGAIPSSAGAALQAYARNKRVQQHLHPGSPPGPSIMSMAGVGRRVWCQPAAELINWELKIHGLTQGLLWGVRWGMDLTLTRAKKPQAGLIAAGMPFWDDLLRYCWGPGSQNSFNRLQFLVVVNCFVYNPDLQSCFVLMNPLPNCISDISLMSFFIASVQDMVWKCKSLFPFSSEGAAGSMESRTV